jgi:hypothetical protein
MLNAFMCAPLLQSERLQCKPGEFAALNPGLVQVVNSRDVYDA